MNTYEYMNTMYERVEISVNKLCQRRETYCINLTCVALEKVDFTINKAALVKCLTGTSRG